MLTRVDECLTIVNKSFTIAHCGWEIMGTDLVNEPKLLLVDFSR